MNIFDTLLKSPVDTFTSGLSSGSDMTGKPGVIAPQPKVISQPLQQPQRVIQSPQSSFIPSANAASNEPLVSDEEILHMMKSGASDDEIKTIVSQLEKERSSGQPQQAPQQPEKSTFDKVIGGLEYAGQGIQNIVGGAVSEIPKVAGNIAEYGVKLGDYNPANLALTGIQAAFSDKTYGQLREKQKKSAEKYSQYGEQGKKFIQKYGAYDPNSIGAKVGTIGTDIAATLVGPGKLFKTAEKANTAIKALAGLANTSIEGTTAAVTNYIATEGRMPTTKEVLEFIALQGGGKVIGETAGLVKKLPSARLIPTTITEAGKDIRRGIDIGEVISKTGISLSKNSLIKKIESKISGISGIIDNKINEAIKQTGPNNITISNVTNGMKELLMNDPVIAKQLQGTPIQRKAISESIDETIQAYKDLYGNKKFDLNGQQQLKKDIYNGLQNVFNKNLQTSKLTAQQVTEKQIAKTLKENIESKVPEISSLNKELAPFMEASKRLNAKGGYSGYLTDILAGGFASGSPSGMVDDPVGYMKNFAIGVLSKRLGTSTLAKTTTSTILKNTEDLFKNPQFQKLILDQYRSLNSNKK